MEGIDPRLEALRARLSGTRQNAPGTVTMYLATAARFLAWVSKDTWGADDVDRYFAAQREAGKSERTMRTEFYQIMALFKANHLPWDFDEGDVPVPKDKPNQPAFTNEQLQALIMAQAQYTEAERIYLAIATTWGCRREALAQLTKRHWAGETLTIPGVHGSETVVHLVPDCLRPLFAAHRLKEHKARSMSDMFHRIITKAGMTPGDGYGWHSIRRRLDTDVEDALPLEFKHFWALSTGWAKEATGRRFFNSRMAGHYYQPDFARIDRQIYEIHPYLKVWEKTLKENPPIVNTGIEPDLLPVVTVSPGFDTMAPETQAAIVELAERAAEQIYESPLDKIIKGLEAE